MQTRSGKQIVVSASAEVPSGPQPGIPFIQMQTGSPALMIQTTDSVIILMITVSRRVNLYCLLCFFRGLKVVL